MKKKELIKRPIIIKILPIATTPCHNGELLEYIKPGVTIKELKAIREIPIIIIKPTSIFFIG